MRFFRFFVLGACLITAGLYGDEDQSESNDTQMEASYQEETSYTEGQVPFCCPRSKYYPIEVRVGYYYFFDSTLRHVYSPGGLDVQLTAAFPVYEFCKGELSIYVAGESVYAKGRSLGAHEKTSLVLFPISLGLKYALNVSCRWDWYVTAGPRYVFVWQHNHSAFIDKNIWGNNIGFFGGTGWFVQLPKRWYLDFYVEGSYCHIKPSVHKTNVFAINAQVGGLAVGIGAGKMF